MKKRLLSKMVAFATATVLVLGSNGLTAFAADGTAADGPKDSGTANESTGKATAEWDTTDEDALDWSVKNDDDNTAAASDTQTDISIWAKVVEHGDIVYKVDISWGAMKFEFNNQAGKWDTDRHEYVVENGGVSAEWTVDGYIDAENNKITVENHSNWAVNATFRYAHDGETDTVFNTESTKTGDSAVRGYFFLKNNQAKAAALNLDNSTASKIADELADALTLGHQDSTHSLNYGGTKPGTELATGDTIEAVEELTEGSCKREVFFTFTGKPDSDKMTGAITKDFTKVGVITVTIAPWENTQ